LGDYLASIQPLKGI